MQNALCRMVVGDGVEMDARLHLEGSLPPGLRGTLYRIGPGLFGCGGARKQHALDGDGFVQRFTIGACGVDYRSRFVRTAKLVAERQAGRMLRPTWSSRASGWWPNVGTQRIWSQAGVTITAADGEMLARDEVGAPWRLQPDSLDTLGEAATVPGADRILPKAHVKRDALSGETVVLGCEYGRRLTLHLFAHSRDGALLRHQIIAAPRQIYFHDFFLTRSHVVVLLHPGVFRPLRFVLGLAAFSDCLSWHPAMDNLWLVIRRDGSGMPRWFEGPAGWMWHGVQAVDQGEVVVVEWVGYDAPDHFLGPDAALRAIMQGRPGRADQPGRLRRTVLDLRSGRLAEEVTLDGNFEFPVIAPSAEPAVAAFMTMAASGTILADGVARVTLASGRLDSFRFGPHIHISEVIPTHDGPDAWVLAVGLDAQVERSFLAVFAAGSVSLGPIALAWLSRSMPGSFHGTWVPE